MTEVAEDVRQLEHQLEEHRVALTGYCYRMLGSPFEAEDAVQETLVRAWRALDRFEGRAALRSWLFGIATNVCIDMLKARRRRALPMEIGPSSPGDALPGRALPEHVWVGPVHDDRVLPANGDPADIAVRESIRLAFVAALQRLTAKQRAALILRDVLRWKAHEVARLLDASTESVESVLRRASAPSLGDGHSQRRGESTSTRPAPSSIGTSRRSSATTSTPSSPLLRDDVTLSMPPYPLWLRGIEAVRIWFGAANTCWTARFVPMATNGSPGLAIYKPTGPDGAFEAFGIQVIEQSQGKIVGIHAFLDPRLFALFDAPLTLAV